MRGLTPKTRSGKPPLLALNSFAVKPRKKKEPNARFPGNPGTCGKIPNNKAWATHTPGQLLRWTFVVQDAGRVHRGLG